MRTAHDSVLVMQVGDLSDQAFCLTDEEGWQHWWNVTQGLRLGMKNHLPQVFSLSQAEITPESILKHNSEIDETYAITTDLTKPLLFVPFKGKDQLIDGWHRLMKAALMGQDDLSGYFLTQKEADACLIMRFPPGQGIEWTDEERELYSQVCRP